jgi:GTPase SAR1 family protein
MTRINIVLQGKGGVGKSMLASTLAQYKADRGQRPLCIDTDPVNATFAGFKALDVARVEIMEGDEINPRLFDRMVERACESSTDVVIDNGASSFVPLAHYLISNEVPAMLRDMGHELVIHTVITGGQALVDTVSGFAQLAGQFPAEALFVVWLNPYFGPIEHEGRSFEQMKAYRENRARVTALVQVPAFKAETHGFDFAQMLQARQTFDEALASPDVALMTKQRLTLVRRRLWEQLDGAKVL